MVRVSNIYDRNKLDTNELVYVETVKKLYRRLEGEWVERVYFSTREVADIMEITPQYTRLILRKLNVRPKIMRGEALDYDQLSKVSAALKLRRGNKNLTYPVIKKMLRL